MRSDWQTDSVLAPRLRQRHPAVTAGVGCLILVGAIKLLFFILDPLPAFFQGDSFSYLSTATSDWIPPDRSVVYGYLIRYLAIHARSLTPLLTIQCLASTGTCLLVYYIARTHLGASARLATAAACCCALDPMQLYYERAVMTETLSTFAFALCAAVAMHYAARPRVRTLLLLAILGIVPITLRVTFVLPVIALCLLPPLYLAVKDVISNAPFKSKFFRLGRQVLWNWRFWQSARVGHLALACACVFAAHYGYCHRPSTRNNPGYLQKDGIFRLAGLAPIVIPADASDPRVAEVLASIDVAFLRDRTKCADHIFRPDCLADRLHRAIPDESECDALAKATAMNALRRAPWQAAVLGWSTWLEYFGYRDMERRLLNGQGADATLSNQEIHTLQANFSLAATPDWGSGRTVTKWMHRNLRCVYYVLLGAPLFALLAVAGTWTKNPLPALLLFSSAASVLATICVFSQPDLRYLHVFGFLTPPVLASLWHQASVWYHKAERPQPAATPESRQYKKAA